MFNKILLTLDLNTPASWEKAMPQAIELARASGGELHIMSVVPDLGTPLVEGFFPLDFEKRAIAAAAKALDKIVTENVPDGITVRQHLAFGKIHKKVLKTIEEIGCDIVVMASPKPDRVREFLVGSNADRIVRRSPVSVLVVRA
jgi:nucleotide-binding universal stress UspA family protein